MSDTILRPRSFAKSAVPMSLALSKNSSRFSNDCSISAGSVKPRC